MFHFFFFFNEGFPYTHLHFLGSFRSQKRKIAKSVTFFTLGGGQDWSLLHFSKTCLKCVSSHSESFKTHLLDWTIIMNILTVWCLMSKLRLANPHPFCLLPETGRRKYDNSRGCLHCSTSASRLHSLFLSLNNLNSHCFVSALSIFCDRQLWLWKNTAKAL